MISRSTATWLRRTFRPVGASATHAARRPMWKALRLLSTHLAASPPKTTLPVKPPTARPTPSEVCSATPHSQGGDLGDDRQNDRGTEPGQLYQPSRELVAGRVRTG